MVRPMTDALSLLDALDRPAALVDAGGKAWNQFFKGTLSGDRMTGEVLVSDGEQQRTIPWTATRIR